MLAMRMGCGRSAACHMPGHVAWFRLDLVFYSLTATEKASIFVALDQGKVADCCWAG